MNEIYLDHAATSHPKPFEVISAVVNAMSLMNANPGRSSYPRAIQASNLIYQARRVISETSHPNNPNGNRESGRDMGPKHEHSQRRIAHRTDTLIRLNFF